MEGILRISSSLSESWPAWLMLFLLVIVVVAEKFQPALLRSVISNLFTIKERDSHFLQSFTDIRAQILIVVYQTSIIAIATYATLFVGGKFSFLTFLCIAAIVLLLQGVKYLISRLVAYVFLDMKTFANAFRHYSNLLTACTLFAYPLLLFILFLPQMTPTAILICTILIYLFYFVCLTIKLFRLFFTNYLACFYILLYLCTLELIPLLVLVETTMWLV